MGPPMVPMWLANLIKRIQYHLSCVLHVTPISAGGLDEYFYESVLGYPLIPYMGHGDGGPWKGGKVVSDALLTAEYTTGKTWDTASFKDSYSKELQEKVLAQWEALGYN
ncbi:hypothetical protein Daesc_007615 [Daldinia eschscholtzii]|uniref:Uncharacterized protein n=1 Tax=Daldinia eschscholtzii TaxID=292717 RepID=A0AAX6MF62_9PEZI